MDTTRAIINPTNIYDEYILSRESIASFLDTSLVHTGNEATFENISENQNIIVNVDKQTAAEVDPNSFIFSNSYVFPQNFQK